MIVTPVIRNVIRENNYTIDFPGVLEAKVLNVGLLIYHPILEKVIILCGKICS